MKLILWDIDGTLMLAYGAGRRAMERTGRAVFGPRFDMSNTSFAGCLDPNIVAEALSQSGYQARPDQLDLFRTRYLLELEEELFAPHTRCELLPGVPALLERALQLRGICHGLVTGNYAAAADLKLRRVQVARTAFQVGAFGDDAATRPELVGLAHRRYEATFNAAPAQTVVIGDTPHDVDCAHAHGAKVIAVATGRYSTHELEACGAELVVPSFEDPDPVLAFLAS